MCINSFSETIGGTKPICSLWWFFLIGQFEFGVGVREGGLCNCFPYGVKTINSIFTILCCFYWYILNTNVSPVNNTAFDEIGN